MKSSPGNRKRLGRRFFRQEPEAVARELLGQTLVHVINGKRLAGKIVETEAYLGVEDKAAHSFGGRRTDRTETMYMDGGTSYVFLNYGIHHLFNVVVAHKNEPKAVLIRAVEPTEGLEQMRVQRSAAKCDTDLCSGPGKVGAAFGIDRRHDSIDLVASDTLFLERTNSKKSLLESVICRRVGVDYAEEWAAAPLRFYIKHNPLISRKAK